MFPLDEQLQTLLTPLGLKIQNLSRPAKLELLTALSEFTSMAHASGVRFGRKYPEGSDKPPLIRNQIMKPIPKPVYPCYECAGLNAWPATDLFWSDHDQEWICDMCWDDRDIEEEKGVCLVDEIKQASPKLGPDIIEMARIYAANKVGPDQSAEDYDLAILEYKYQLRKAQEVDDEMDT